MNVIKYRPVGQPNGKVVRVRVTQSKRAINTRRGVSVAMANKVMDRKGFVRAGVRHG